MLPRTARLRRRSDFARVYSKGRSYATDLVVMYVLPGRAETTRVGFSVSSKLGKSAARNRVRRRLREVVRPLLPSIRGKYDLVVAARRKSGEARIEDLRKAFVDTLRRSGIARVPDRPDADADAGLDAGPCDVPENPSLLR
ncbi:MAG: ribonuclease P protein component [Armatimonadota bacterium]